MSYLTQDAIANNRFMLARVAQAAAEEDITSDPDRWAYDNRRDWASAPGWSDAWESALVSHPDDGDPATPAYDPGADEGVITDSMILSQVQSMTALPGLPTA
jgi:hypothetical protein